jgi:predicted flavoprotein YhiN
MRMRVAARSTERNDLRDVDVIILGAGAAGLMAAIEAGRRGRRVLVLDHADKPGKKILISGGGRCNFTNLGTRPDNFLSQNPHFAKSALAAYTPRDFVALVEKHRIPFHEKTLGQLFCDGSSREIVALLEAECAEASARIQLNTRIHSLVPGRGKREDGFTLETTAGTLHAASVVVATGGLSIPKMGATGFGYEIARQFGLQIVPTRPALVPFTLHADDLHAWCDLSGVSALVSARLIPSRLKETVILSEAGASPRSRRTPTVPTPATPSGPLSPDPPSSPVAPQRPTRTRPPAFREKLLITHRGLSGPAILQISSYWGPAQPIALDLAPDQRIFDPLTAPQARRDPAAALAALKTILPTRWAERWLQAHLPPETPRQLGNATLAALERDLHAWTLTPAGTEGYEKAEVTAGGVDTAELDARTLQCRKVPGLYFIGEVVDVTGWLGGYNFQWAWASGAAAGRSA